MVCEGTVTEPAYLKGFERWVRNAAVEVEVADEQGDPRRVVEIAKRRTEDAARAARRHGDAFLAYDETWCVFDRDEHKRFHDACQMAVDNGFGLAVSHPCFELWLYLHFTDSPGAQHRHTVQKMLGKYLPGYDKRLSFDGLGERVAAASVRARRLDRDAAEVGEPRRNPTTSVYELTDSIARKDADG